MKNENEYVYDIGEYSQDSRHYQVTSNVKLTYYEVQQIYSEVDINKSGDTTHNLQQYIDWSDERFSEDDIKNKINVSVRFEGTEYGDDCQLDITGELEND